MLLYISEFPDSGLGQGLSSRYDDRRRITKNTSLAVKDTMIVVMPDVKQIRDPGKSS